MRVLMSLSSAGYPPLFVVGEGASADRQRILFVLLAMIDSLNAAERAS
jgi:hypothetical protein